MKLKHALIACVLLLSQQGWTQDILSGKFIDKAAHPVAYLQVVASRGHAKPFKTLTDSAGVFKLNLPAGKYTLHASLFGNPLYTKRIALAHDLDLGVIRVKSALALGAVVVNAHKPLVEQKLDRLVFNVENAVVASGGDALDALRITPGVQLRDDGLSLIGKGDMRVMVDGRILPLQGESLIDFLQSIPADDIERIEVITNPPAQYEAAGNGGLINIVYKKGRRDHWNAILSNSYRYNTLSYYRTGGHLSYRKDKLTLLLNLNGAIGGGGGSDVDRTYYLNETWVETTDKDWLIRRLSARLALDYEPTEKSSLGLQYFGEIGRPNDRHDDVMSIYEHAGELEAQIKTHDHSDIASNNQALNLHYRFKPDSTGKVYSTDLDYFNYDHERDRHLKSQRYRPDGQADHTILKADNKGEQHIKNYSAKVDVTQPTKWLALAYGAKLSRTQSDNIIAFFDTRSGERIPKPDQSDHFDYTENTWALYLSTSKKLGERWQGKWGLRLEDTRTKGVSETSGEIHKDHYTEWFPTLYLAYTPKFQVFALSYGKRIKRPTYHRLDPTRWYFSGTSYVQGNPALQPSFTDHFTLSHTWKKKLTSSLNFYITRDGFEQVPSFNPKTGQQIYTQENYYTNRLYSLEESFRFKPYPWWQSQAALHLNYVEYELDPDKIVASNMSGPFMYISTNNSLSFNRAHTFGGELNFWYVSRQKSIIFVEEPMYSLDLGLSASLLDKRLKIALSGHDILKSNAPYQTVYVNRIKQVSRYYWYSRSVNLSIKFQVGNQKLKVAEKAFGNEEERKRT